MGCFSWCVEGDSRDAIRINNGKSKKRVYLVTPDNEYIAEDYYEGYGVFGGKDAYALLAKWNCPDKCNGDVDHDRSIGIHLTYDREDVLDDKGRRVDPNTTLKYPLKFARNKKLTYDELLPATDDPNQGFGEWF